MTKSKKRKQKIKDKITIISGSILLLMIFISVCISFWNARTEKKLAAIQDVSLLQYEGNISVANKVSLIYEIYDNDSYLKAMNELPCTQQINDELFADTSYSKSALYYTAPSVSVLSTQYKYTEGSTDAYEYLVELSFKNNDTSAESFPTCLVTVQNKTITDIKFY